MADPSNTSSFLWLLTEPIPACPCHSCTGEPSTGPRTPGKASSVLSGGTGSHPQICWKYSLWYGPGHCWSSLWEWRIDASWSAWCSPGPPGLLLQSCFLASEPSVSASAWNSSSPGADSAFPLVELHGVPVILFLQPMQVPLNDNTGSWCNTFSSWFFIVSKFAEDALCHIIQFIKESVK